MGDRNPGVGIVRLGGCAIFISGGGADDRDDLEDFAMAFSGKTNVRERVTGYRNGRRG